MGKGPGVVNKFVIPILHGTQKIHYFIIFFFFCSVIHNLVNDSYSRVFQNPLPRTLGPRDTNPLCPVIATPPTPIQRTGRIWFRSEFARNSRLFSCTLETTFYTFLYFRLQKLFFFSGHIFAVSISQPYTCNSRYTVSLHTTRTRNGNSYGRRIN